MLKSIAVVAIMMGTIVLILVASMQPVPASAINLHDDAATIAAADAAKYEVIRRQQEQARIARETAQAAIAATRVEEQHLAQQTRQANEATATQQALYVQATATEQASISRTLALSGTAAAVAIMNAQATQTQVAATATARAISTAEALSVKAENARIEADAWQRILNQARQGLNILGGAVLMAAGIGALVLLWRFALAPRLQTATRVMGEETSPLQRHGAAVMVDERGRLVDEGKPEPLSPEDIARIVKEVPQHGQVSFDPAAAEAAWSKLEENGDLERAVE